MLFWQVRVLKDCHPPFCFSICQILSNFNNFDSYHKPLSHTKNNLTFNLQSIYPVKLPLVQYGKYWNFLTEQHVRQNVLTTTIKLIYKLTILIVSTTKVDAYDCDCCWNFCQKIEKKVKICINEKLSNCKNFSQILFNKLIITKLITINIRHYMYMHVMNQSIHCSLWDFNSCKAPNRIHPGLICHFAC